MKSKSFLVAFIFLLSLTLAGCTCSHEWTDADCVNPQTCTKCSEIGAPATGHNWNTATCTLPETCSNCGATQGEPAAHIYGEWIFNSNDMERTCSICGHIETTEINRELYLESLLPGYWDFFGMYTDAGYTPAAKLEVSGIGFHFNTDRTSTFHVPETGTQQVTWSFDSYKQEDGADSYYFTLTGETQTYPMCLRHNRSGDTSQPEKQLILLSKQLLMFSQYESLNNDLVGDWGIKTDQWGNILGNPGNWLTFRPDRTVTGNLNGAIDGVWYVTANYYTNFLEPDEYSILIENSDGEMKHVLTFTPGGKPTLDVRIGRARHSFSHINENELDQVKIANSIHLGTWTSTKLRYRGETETFCSEYSVTLNEDFTFTARLDREIHGVWILQEIPYTSGSSSYRYNLIPDGSKSKIYCQLLSYQDDPQLLITHYEPWEATQVHFIKMTEEATKYITLGNTFPVGNWLSYDYYIRNSQDYSIVEDHVQSEDYSLTFHPDGTLTAALHYSVSGSWSYYDFNRHYEDDSPYYEWRYEITAHNNAFRSSEDIRCDELTFFIIIQHPENENWEIVYRFRKVPLTVDDIPTTFMDEYAHYKNGNYNIQDLAICYAFGLPMVNRYLTLLED